MERKATKTSKEFYNKHKRFDGPRIVKDKSNELSRNKRKKEINLEMGI